MIRFLLIVLLFLLFGALAVYFRDDFSGFILIVINDTSIEIDLGFAALAMLVCALLLWLAWGLLRGSVKDAISINKRWKQHRLSKAHQRLVNGLINYIEGDWHAARTDLLRSAKLSNNPKNNYLISARCAHLLGDTRGAKKQFQKAKSLCDDQDHSLLLTKAWLCYQNKAYPQALEILESIPNPHANSASTLELQQKIYLAQKDWASLNQLNPLLRQHHHSLEIANDSIESLHYQYQFTQAIQHLHSTNSLSRETQLAKLDAIWHELPRKLKKERSWFLTFYTKQMMNLGHSDRAEKLLRDALDDQFDDSRFDLYGLLVCSNPLKPLKIAEAWLTREHNNAALLLALGRQCIINKQWGRALDFLSNSLRVKPRNETHAELGRLHQAMGNHKESTKYFMQAALMLSDHLLPDSVYQKVQLGVYSNNESKTVKMNKNSNNE